ncbi:MAG: signal recognition particle-docking protein FtsY [Rickettsiales bacterium]|nr:signal recognition particle-docking protein FtsY [Rickettsiales bacterium]
MNLFRRIKESLSKSSKAISEGISSVFTKRKLDDEALNELEEILIMADMGVKTSAEIIAGIRKKKFDKEVTEEEIKQSLSEEILNILSKSGVDNGLDFSKKPLCLMFVGVNGTGKTTSIGKLSAKLQKEGKKVLISACDTFRAAAVEQLAKWAERSGADFFSGVENQDPASVAFQAYEKAKIENYDVILIDTAGRLQNKKGLMEELAKISRVLKKHNEELPHKTILVLDATTGQNAVSQAEIFSEIAKINSLIITKLDGSAKGGVVVGIVDKFKIPIFKIGVGEGLDDLENFNPEDFSKSLVGLG